MARLNFRWPFLLAVLSTLLATSAATDTMNPGDTVADGKFLISTGGGFQLGFFTPGSLSRFRYLGIWYGTISQQTVIWVANRERGINDSTGVLSFHGNGSLVLSDARGEVYWSTGAAAGVASPVARLLDSANFVVNGSGGGAPAWQSFDYPTDTLLPGMKLGWDLRAGRNRKITPWRSDDDPAPGDFSVGMDEWDDLQIYLLHKTPGARQYNWRSGPWNGQRFSGIPEMSDYDNDMFTFFSHNGSDEVYFQFDTRNKSGLLMLAADHSGELQMKMWVLGSWYTIWSAPKDQCDTFSTCGPFGVCEANSTSHKCSCLQGFEPGRSPQARSFSDGCARRTALDCRNGTDGFVKETVAKRPDTSAASVHYNVGLEQCRKWCLDDCTCTAYANAEVTGAGCTLWFDNLTDIRGYAVGGSDLNVRLAAADLDRRQSSAAPPTYVVPPSVTVQSASSSSQKKKSASSTSKRVFPVAATAVGALLGTVVLGWICWFLWRRQRRRRLTKTTTERVLRKNGDVVAAGSGTKTKKNTSNAYQKGTSAAVEDLDDLPLIDFTSIAAATDGFSVENKLGEGGFGPVYVGRLGDGQEVAVKRLARNSVQGLHEFKNEVVLIAKLQHRNLVRLLGCCIQGDEKILVYEYMPNKSLDAFLFDKTKGSLLDWNTRYKIIKGIARGLLYLHQDSRLRIIHRDLKASNVLLDKEMNPKISDFGMARMFSGDQTEANTRRVVGTYGYMSPEYIMEGHFSVKSDVFSFGVVLLEIVSGERNRAMYLSDPNLNLLGYAWSLWKASKWMEMVDSSIVANGFPTVEVLKCIKVGLLCVQERPEDRPTMATVVEMWGDNMESLPQPKQPAFMATRGPFEVWSLSKGKLCSINEVTVTDVCDGR